MFNRSRLALAAAAASLALVATGSPAATALPEWKTTRTASENPHAFAPKVLDLRWAEHKRFDRVVIDVRGVRPGYWVGYVRRLGYDGSGATVPLKGHRKMALRLFPAYAHNDKGANLYDGPRLLQVDLPTLRGIAFTGDFEGQVSFGFTTRRKAPYRIFTLSDPTRVVIDWKH